MIKRLAPHLAALLATAIYSLVIQVEMPLTGNRYRNVRFIQVLLLYLSMW